MTRMLKSFVLAFSALLILACTATPTSESAGQYLDSSTITAKVKAELIDQLGANSLSVKVKTYKDEVQLSGFVNSQIIKQRAGIAAAQVSGVKRVRNDLIVK